METTKNTNLQEFSLDHFDIHQISSPTIVSLPAVSGLTISPLVPQHERLSLLDTLSSQKWEPTSIFNDSTYSKGDRIGSWKVSTLSPSYASVLWWRLEFFVPSFYVIEKFSGQKEVWKTTGLNPLLRFAKYEDDGVLLPHYDKPCIESENKRSFKSLVIYLDTDETVGGATRFIRDSQSILPTKERELSDWKVFASPTEVSQVITPTLGKGLVFAHDVLHDSEKTMGIGHKIILSTDIMYERM